MLQQGRAGVLRLSNSAVQNAGRQGGQSFSGALQAMGFAIADDFTDSE